MIIDQNMILLTEIKKALIDASIEHTLNAISTDKDIGVNVAVLKLGNEKGLAAFLESVVDGAVQELPSIRGTIKLSFGERFNPATDSDSYVKLDGELIVPVSTSIDEARLRLQNTESVIDTILVKADRVEMRRVFKDLVIRKTELEGPWPMGTIYDLLVLLKIRS